MPNNGGGNFYNAVINGTGSDTVTFDASGTVLMVSVQVAVVWPEALTQPSPTTRAIKASTPDSRKCPPFKRLFTSRLKVPRSKRRLIPAAANYQVSSSKHNSQISHAPPHDDSDRHQPERRE